MEEDVNPTMISDYIKYSGKNTKAEIIRLDLKSKVHIYYMQEYTLNSKIKIGWKSEEAKDAPYKHQLQCSSLSISISDTMDFQFRNTTRTKRTFHND